MAQINIRVPDEGKAIAENVVAKAGLSLTEYLRTVIDFISEHGTLPVVIQTKTEAIDPNEVFQEAVLRFRNAYGGVVDLFDKVLHPGEMTPLDKLRVAIDDVQSAESFYSLQEHAIEQAPFQLERIAISEGEFTMFARCREHFPRVAALLRNAIRMVNMNNRPVSEEDLGQMRQHAEEAARHINILQGMISTTTSAESSVNFFLRDVREALECARAATKPSEALVLRTAWQNRMSRSIRQAERGYRRLGVVPCLKELDAVMKALRAARQAIDTYLERPTDSRLGFNVQITQDLEDALLDAEQKARK
ncbi:hypothetical protein [Burkholderia cepacia]|uniref:hypothetical protein n=1 Tax=Burkholderia cepacia TaxID=292 RepID=UPI002148CE27|nr:hypothetical protein [Burkholderia cepacia]